MLNTVEFGEKLKELGYDFFSGVPCSFLKSLINYAINDCNYIHAANEGDAIAISSGSSIGGKKSVVLMQNSGLMNAVSPLVSLNAPFKIPLLGFVSLRGEPGISDEPQHELTGKITTDLLELMEVKWGYLSKDIEKAKQQLEEADRWIEKGQSFFFVVKKGTFLGETLKTQESRTSIIRKKEEEHSTDELPTRFEVLSAINMLKDEKTVQLATTGKTGRELFEIEDADHNLYMVGSMGCISSLGLGLALSRNDLDCVVIDGDGSLLMRMGSLATNGYYQPSNMLHILLDNNSHDSTGGQKTVSHNTHFVDIASSSGYPFARYVHTIDQLKSAINQWKEEKGLTFIYMKIAKGSKEKLGRPTLKPHEVKNRLERFINKNN
ncbi:phosphonopyruvate decarboxylase [Alkalihalobacillus sp. MEB130]|uniref:phosphonopyruvate decarboxylase n=1 Tax=Alkalihalobacillus sp. MEB130 TaxID=2976704 RepID=UPI0028DFA322|nr:phosphonopyruvate decarboxylase [Alkalihalobacillus sp. MEB130]MDT8861214.1 phosphonopyruvate decarboxylase [Alkalihalobacillus sp. MEB130]